MAIFAGDLTAPDNAGQSCPNQRQARWRRRDGGKWAAIANLGSCSIGLSVAGGEGNDGGHGSHHADGWPDRVSHTITARPNISVIPMHTLALVVVLELVAPPALSAISSCDQICVECCVL